MAVCSHVLKLTVLQRVLLCCGGVPVRCTQGCAFDASSAVHTRSQTNLNSVMQLQQQHALPVRAVHAMTALTAVMAICCGRCVCHAPRRRASFCVCSYAMYNRSASGGMVAGCVKELKAGGKAAAALCWYVLLWYLLVGGGGLCCGVRWLQLACMRPVTALVAEACTYT